jgi:histidine triad (HIT) family protein
MEKSIFTRLIEKELPSFCIYEDDTVFAFLDIHPITPGHTLIVPKKQVEFVWDLDEQDYSAVMKVTKKLAAHLRSQLKVRFIGEQIIGVDVPHAHVHLVPFNTVDEYRHIPDPNTEPDFETLAKMHEQLRVRDAL